MDKPAAAMVFAAGFGTRMRPLTDTRPKPLIDVAGRALLDHAIELVDDAGARPVVNAHYKSEMVEAHLADRPDIQVLTEAPKVLDTGGGLKNACGVLGADPVFALNSDAVWGGPNPLELLSDAWRPEMDALLMLVPLAKTVGYSRAGNFSLDHSGRLRPDPAGHVYTGAQILRTDKLAAIPDDIFSLHRLWDQFLTDGTAYGTIYPGRWADVGTPDGIALAEAMLRETLDV